MTTFDAAAPRFDMGRVVKRMFDAVGRNLVVFGLLSLILGAGPQLVISLAAAAIAAGGAASGLGFLFMIIGGLGAIVGAYVLQAALVHGVVRDLNGQKADFGDCLSTGFRHFLPVLALAILMTIAVCFGLIFLLVPGVFMALVWCVAVPSEVVERTGVFGAFSRSADLTRHHRGAIFGLFMAFVLLSWILSAVVFAVGGGLNGAYSGQFAIGTQIMAGNFAPAVVSVVSQTVQGVLGAAGLASLYYELRLIKEGIGPESLASVFD